MPTAQQTRVTRAAALERKLVKLYAGHELVQLVECYHDEDAHSIVVYAQFAGDREHSEYIGEDVRAWELYRDAQTAISQQIQKLVREYIESVRQQPQSDAADVLCEA
ncbi:hypothetical protein SEA_EASTWEST_60 [Arthrobacter phage EastWest]|uniref:Uncharacterized protein n=1 Tax=Arthrobacter phage EastWest TaxID=2894292 RepID=A0AAE8YK81_9CAUD|nr:hypothetical protein SEA_EASTWEST_60 [Arthrobacter phage EastWest]